MTPVDHEVTPEYFCSPQSIARLRAKIAAQDEAELASYRIAEAHNASIAEKLLIVAGMLWLGIITFGLIGQLLTK